MAAVGLPVVFVVPVVEVGKAKTGPGVALAVEGLPAVLAAVLATGRPRVPLA